MALDRQSIEKKDFPVGRRGYDPEAVDSHLTGLADEVAELKRTSRQRSDTLASSASEQVRAIVEAAETSAHDIQRDAESDAKEIRDEANSEAQHTREQATEQAREYLGKVSESTDTMVKRLDTMQSELDQLVESLRTGSRRLGADLKLLQTNLHEVTGVVAPRPQFEPETGSEHGIGSEHATGSEHGTDASPAFGTSDGVSGTDAAPAESQPAAGAVDGASATSSVTSGAPGGEDAEGARLIALNMALNGTPRAETEKYLHENFSLSDAGGLLDEVYSSVEG